MDSTALRAPKLRTRADRLEEERIKQEELVKRQQEEFLEKVRKVKRYVISRAAEQENSKTEAQIGLKSGIIEKNAEEAESPVVKDSESIMSAIGKIKIQPSKKKIIKHYMLDNLKEIY
jgi:hypothetical protein